MGRILTLARNDAQRILSEMGFETEITLTKDNVSVNVNGVAPVHHLAFDTDGQPVNSKSAHVTISEITLSNVGFTVRNSKNEVFMRNVLVTFQDSSGVSKTYIVKENYADESIGTVLLNLGSYAE